MRLKILFLFLFSATCSLKAQSEFPVLTVKQKAWESARNLAHVKVEKKFLARLVELKVAAVKKGDLDAARAFDKATKGEANNDDEPTALIKLRRVRKEALEAALKAVDKQYWEELKSLKGFAQRQGDLKLLESVTSEIDSVLKAYAAEPSSIPQKKRELIVRHAVFGSDAAAVSVIEKVKKYAEDTDRVVRISSSGMSIRNPRAYTRDSLLVEYELNGVAKQIRIPNGKKINFHELLRDPSAEIDFPRERGKPTAEDLNRYLINTSWSVNHSPVEEGLIFYSDGTFRRPDNSLKGRYVILDGETAQLFWGGQPNICKFSSGRLSFKEINGGKNTFRFLGRLESK